MLRKYDVAGVYREEYDRSNAITAAGTSVGAIPVRAPQGPVNMDVVVSTYDEFTQKFGNIAFEAATGDVPVFGYAALAAKYHLSQSDELHVVRITDSNDKYSMARFKNTFTNASIYSSSAVSNEGISASMTPSTPDTANKIQALNNGIGTTDLMLIGTVGPGTAGNNFGVTIETFSMSADWMFNYDPWSTHTGVAAAETSASQGLFSTVTAFNNALSAYGVSATDILPVATKVVKINVYKKSDTEDWDDINTAIAANQMYLSAFSPINTYYGTIDYTKDAAGRQLKITEVVNGIDSNIYVVTNSADLPTGVLPSTTGIFKLAGGAVSKKTGLGSTDTAVLTGWQFFANREFASVNMLINCDWNTSVKQYVAQIAANRMDCIAIGQSGAVTDNTVTKVIAAEAYGYLDPSYMALYGGWDLIVEPLSGKQIYIPKACFAGMLFSRIDRTVATWAAPAGIPNGILPSLGQNVVFSFNEIGQLNKAHINTSRWMKTSGHIIWAQQTAQLAKSARDRISTRRLLIYVENSVEEILTPFLFNIVNDEKSRDRLAGLTNDFLGTLKGGPVPGVLNAVAICNDKNNTNDVIDNEQLVVDLFLRPALPVEDIILRATVVNGSVNWSEISGG